MLQGRREVRLLRLSLGRPAAPNTYGGSIGNPWPESADCVPERASRGSVRTAMGRVPETSPCPLSAVQNGRLTWASEPAARSRRLAGRQVRCRLGRRAAVAMSLRTPPAVGVRRRSTRDKNPRLPYGRPIKASEVGIARTSTTPRKRSPKRAGAMRVTHGSITGSPRQIPSVPKCAFSRGFLSGVHPWRASVRRFGSTARSGGGSRRTARGRTARGRRGAPRHRHMQSRTQLQRAFVDRQPGHCQI
jgi:hypothetical protein